MVGAKEKRGNWRVLPKKDGAAWYHLHISVDVCGLPGNNVRACIYTGVPPTINSMKRKGTYDVRSSSTDELVR